MSATVINAKGDLEGALRKVAQKIFEVCKAQPSSEPLVLGLCGGRSVVGLLGALEKESASQPRDVIERMRFFMVDERLVPITDEQSNYGGLKRLLFDSLVEKKVITEDQLHPFMTDNSLKDFGCSKYLEELQSCGGRFTVVVLGVGEDGHIAGLFPGHLSLRETSKKFVHFHDSPKPPPDRMSASPALIAGADLSVVIALGEGKSAAWRAFNDESVGVSECPAKLARQAGSCVVVSDLV